MNKKHKTQTVNQMQLIETENLEKLWVYSGITTFLLITLLVTDSTITTYLILTHLILIPWIAVKSKDKEQLKTEVGLVYTAITLSIIAYLYSYAKTPRKNKNDY